MSSTYTPLLEKAKAHHRSVNAAYSTYYGAGTTSASPSSRPSMDSRRSSSNSSSSSSTTSTLNKAWTTIKRAAREHHESVDAAYATYYGQGARVVVETPRLVAVPVSAEGLKASASIFSEDSINEMDEIELEKEDMIMRAEREKEMRQREESVASKTWKRVKRAAREHHEGVTQAYAVYYGQGTAR